MPKVGSSNRAFRLPDVGLWERFGEVAEPDRSEVLREFIRWYVREQGAKLPRRPEPLSLSADTDHAPSPPHSAA
jgi:hypothetical protein